MKYLLFLILIFPQGCEVEISETHNTNDYKKAYNEYCKSGKYKYRLKLFEGEASGQFYCNIGNNKVFMDCVSYKGYKYDRIILGGSVNLIEMCDN